MDIETFKDMICNPLKKTIEQHKSPTLAQITSREDLTRQWDRTEGMQMSLTHIENVYASITSAQPQSVDGQQQEYVQEVLPPQ